ncbi:hypothetical protein LEL_07999 [Akanthomyces lecanii RCEF 1005]|uniref:Uncharacterized protein n=1 Tax=Akanthomyces lecanii RCEF 1005 TaxID=1081108 RepID=A0A162KG42_CORDF|nr:hypothetical protein LEL_07999 [Akanthomyces lecanii RCEF 1005]
MSFERKKAGYENAIDHFEKLAVEDPTWNILEPIWADERLRQKYHIADISFTNGIRNFNDLNEDLETRVKTERGKQQPDGGGIRTDMDGDESAAFMYDYKAAHKFAVEYLEAALAKETLFMDVHQWTQAEQYRTDLTEAVNEAERILKKWKKEDYMDLVTPPEQHNTDSSSAPPSRGTDGSFDCDASPATRKYPLRLKSSCNDSVTLLERHDGDDHDGAEAKQRQSEAGVTRDKRERGSSNRSSNDGAQSSPPAPTRQYCTQTCLLGLKLGRTLDSRCPNVLSHCVRGGAQHPINATEFTELVGEQLR